MFVVFQLDSGVRSAKLRHPLNMECMVFAFEVSKFARPLMSVRFVMFWKSLDAAAGSTTTPVV